MRRKSGAKPETPQICLMLCWFPAKKPGVCWGQTGDRRKRREIAGKRGEAAARQLGKAVKSGSRVRHGELRRLMAHGS